MPSAIEVNFFHFFVFFNNSNFLQKIRPVKNFNDMKTQKFQVQFGFENVGQNTLRINVQKFPNPRK